MNSMLWLWILPFAVLLTLADWRQTVRIFAPDSRWRELNPLIVRMVRVFGAPLGVHLWFLFVMACIALVLWLTTEQFRVAVLAVTAVLEAYWVFNNVRIGIRIF